MPYTAGVFFENLPLNCKKEDVRHLFERFGTLQTVFLATRLSGKSLGFGYVLYSTAAEAERAVHALNGLTMIPGCTLKVSLQDFTDIDSYETRSEPPVRPR